ncbi:MAG: glycogen debranching protein [Bacteroidetes bacterium]|jgi:hypothetical protein|nr:glycogen debranching protein [Bacteroidota bacterium]
MPASFDPSIDAALDLLHAVTTPDGILASPTDVTNYRRVWARDSVMCGLAGLVAGDDRITQGLKDTLEALAAAGGPDGQIPSNLAIRDGHITDVSYGGLSGRVDAISWFVVGLAQYVQATGDAAFGARHADDVRRGLQLLTAWEYNRRGLVYVPLGGDWADEYILHGYVLFDQVMRVWALRGAEMLGIGDAAERRDTIEQRITATFRLDLGGSAADGAYHPYAAEQVLKGGTVPSYWLPALSPGGYQTMFDAWGNALAVLLGLGDDASARRTLEAGESMRSDRPGRLIPAFWPPVREGDPDWHLLQGNHRGTFQNHPGHYHNGGLWPMVNGWWGCALGTGRQGETARDVLNAIHGANRRQEGDPALDTNDTYGPSGEWLFPEYRDAETAAPGGTRPLAWSAAGAVILDRHLAGNRLSYVPATPDLG